METSVSAGVQSLNNENANGNKGSCVYSLDYVRQMYDVIYPMPVTDKQILQLRNINYTNIGMTG
ncbi:hypothetical protein ACFQ21_29775 [Ohtaekwangia kribbensis]|uniref:Uncharacterized protein n=1 Tax=Ohtaekwangia kribbensis TaxID=688913 RepID=A0ABW3KD63_9BACT